MGPLSSLTAHLRVIMLVVGLYGVLVSRMSYLVFHTPLLTVGLCLLNRKNVFTP